MKKYVGVVLGAIIASEAQGLPDVIDITMEGRQHKDKASLCVGRGMSDKLTSEVAVKAIWYESNQFSWFAGYSKEFCMLNKESLSEGKFSVGIGYRFIL